MNDAPDLVPDVNKVIAELAQKIITDSASAVISKGKNFFKGISNDIRLKFESSYKEYLTCVYERYSKAKSFLIRDESTLLYDFYVPMGISCGKKNAEEASIFNFTNGKNTFGVIKGSAGSGKSMMMRYLFLNTIEKEVKVPIFIELRKINDVDSTLLAFIKSILTENKFSLDDDYVEKALKAGHFALFLDGFDEIAISKRKQLIKEIKELANVYEKNVMIISSRPDDEFSSWNMFDVWEITPLTLTQALRLIKKVPSKNIDEETRDKFLKDLEKELFKKHRSFLSNPLLLSIMVITYASSGDVPQKISTFYENAYIALFERHDALKGAFKRDRNCNLDILEFKKIFSAFSILTSSNLTDAMLRRFGGRALRLPKTEALNYIERAREISDVSTDFSNEDFLQDCIKAVCLLIEDGLEITYAHRSFQEYFTALFISNLDDIETQQELIMAYFFGRGGQTIELLFQINPSLVEKLLLIPRVELLEKEIGFNRTLSKLNYKKFLRLCFIKIEYFGAEFNDMAFSPLMVRFNADKDRLLDTYLFMITHYLDNNFEFVLSKKTKTFLTSFFEDAKNLEAESESDVRKHPIIFQVLAEDKEWGFSKDNLLWVLEERNKLIIKHKQINIARKENLLKRIAQKKIK